MSYQVLARKWRPKSFEELVGQKQTAKALINALETQRLHHAYLFSGTRGVGKTTIARILSKSLNCEKGITSKPCGECSSCVEIDQGNFVDLMEIDAASKTKVEDTRELLDNVQYRPTRGRYKVYLIDEVHMLSGHSFNALLKTLEEPPPHVIFLLATTDPQKLPVTVLSRCLQFNLKRMEEPQIVDHLDMILTAEQIQFEREALTPIAKGADGSMRDALSLLDQAIAYCGEKLELTSVLEMLGSIDQSYCFQLLESIRQDDASALMNVIQQMSQYSPDYFEVMSDWLNLLHRIAVAQATGNTEDEKISQLAESISAADLQLYYQLSLQAKKDLPYAPHPRQGFEMALLRVLAFRPKKAPSPANSSKPTHSANTSEPTEQSKKKLAQPSSDVSAVGRHQNENTARIAELNPETNLNQTPQTESRVRLVTDNTALFDSKDRIKNQPQASAESKPAITQEPTPAQKNTPAQITKTAEPPVEYGQRSISSASDASQRVNNFENIDDIGHHRLYPDVLPVSLEQINFDNWHYLVDQMSVAGNGLQVLMNSLAIFEDNRIKINHLSKVSHLLTKNLRESLIAQIRQHFIGDGSVIGDGHDDNRSQFAVEFTAAEKLAETPKQKQIKQYQADIEVAYQKLIDDHCVAKLQQALGATIDRQSIRLNLE